MINICFSSQDPSPPVYNAEDYTAFLRKHCKVNIFIYIVLIEKLNLGITLKLMVNMKLAVVSSGAWFRSAPRSV